jgi:hypothetical protein
MFDTGAFGAAEEITGPLRTYEHGKKGTASWHGFGPG